MLLIVNLIHEDLANLTSRFDELKDMRQWNLNLKFQKTAQIFSPNK